MTNSTLDYAITMENKIHKRLFVTSNQWHLKKASIWAMNETGLLKKLCENKDVYELLDSPKTLTAIEDANKFVVLTCGWAAPIDSDITDNDVAPSQHPERRRVRLVVAVDTAGVASVLRFENKPTEIVTDEGDAKGSLADAVMDLMNKKINSILNKLGENK